MDKALLGKKIRVARKAARLTQQALATAAGCSKSLISDIENGRTAPSAETLVKIARAARASLDELTADDLKNAI